MPILTRSVTEPWLDCRLSRKQEAALQVAQHDPPPEQASGFFRLSAELRNIIYEMLIVAHDDALWVSADRHSYIEDIGPGPIPPPITQVCRLFRAETLPIYYGVNTFSVTLVRERNVGMVKRWLHAVGDVGVSKMQKLRLRGYGWNEGGYWQSDLSVVISRDSRGASNNKSDDQASASAGLSIAPEIKDKNRVSLGADMAQLLNGCVASFVAEHDGAVSVDLFECTVETFASRCTFRSARPAPPPTIQL